MSTDWMYDVLALCIVFMNLRILIMIVEKIKLANMLCYHCHSVCFVV